LNARSAKEQKQGALQRWKKSLFGSAEDGVIPEEAGKFVGVLNKAANETNPKKSKDAAQIHLQCQAFFKKVGGLLGGEAAEEWKSYGNANDICQKIIERPSKWRSLKGKTDIQIQEMANKGAVIVGVVEDIPHGHVAIVSPVPPELNLKKFGGNGPMVRDGNIYDQKKKHPELPATWDNRAHPKDWGTVRASMAFDYKHNAPKWFLWVPDH
jgi:hypothetical protein